MFAAILIVSGFAVGVVVGRWWALIAPAAFGIWIALVAEVEFPGWLLGAVYALVGAVGVISGVLLRRFANRRARPS